jgi:hypothetical protein
MAEITHVSFYNTQKNDDVNDFMGFYVKYVRRFGQRKFGCERGLPVFPSQFMYRSMYLDC